MFTPKSFRIGLTGALLVIITGAFTACGDSSPTEPTSPQYSGGNCTVIGGVVVCEN
jgi:hypothetical protein